MTIGAGVVLRPQRQAVAVVTLKSRIVPVHRPPAGVHQSGEGPLGWNLVIGGKRKVVVFDGWVFAPRFLETIHHAKKDQGAADRTRNSPQTHATFNPRIAPVTIGTWSPLRSDA